MLIDVDFSHLYCTSKNILRRGFRTILNKISTLNSSVEHCHHCGMFAFTKKTKSAFKIRLRSVPEVNQTIFVISTSDSSNGFGFDCLRFVKYCSIECTNLEPV